MYIPQSIFLTKGVGKSKEQLTSFEMALRNASIAPFNLVSVSSIYPAKILGHDLRTQGQSKRIYLH